MMLNMNTITESKNPLEEDSKQKLKFGPKSDSYEIDLLNRNKIDQNYQLPP